MQPNGPIDPQELWLLRHGQSFGNVARDSAAMSEAEVLDIADRDMDVPLSELGREQSAAFGGWLAGQEVRPTVVISSPYVRAVQTAEIVADEGHLGCRVRTDERLREREFGILDLLTRRGIEARFPFESERRRRLGKFYHRPPGGESWVDVALRTRSLRDSIAREHLGERVLLVAHEVPILIWRYLIEELTETETLAISRDEPLANCSLTRYVNPHGDRLELVAAGWTVPMDRSGVEVTEEHDAAVAPRERVDEGWLERHPLTDVAAGDKYERGTVLVVGGSPDTPGAVQLAGRAALRMGAGRLRIATARSVVPFVAASVPEAMVTACLPHRRGARPRALRAAARGVRVILIGPGQDPGGVARVVGALIEAADEDCRFVLDACAITTVEELSARHRASLAGRTILTPNRQEAAHAAPDDSGDALHDLAIEWGAVVTSFRRVVDADGREYDVPTEHAGLGTSGSGDVLAGLVAGAAALTADLATAACWATYAHAEAGRRLLARRRVGAFLASELVDAVGLCAP